MKRTAMISLLWLANCAGPAPAPAESNQLAVGSLPPLGKLKDLRQSSPDNADVTSYAKSDAIYPAKSTELIALQSPVKNQDQRGVCTIFTTTGLMEHLYIKAGMKDPSFSEQYLQWAVKVQLGEGADAEGSDIGSNIRAINHYGIVNEMTYPYNPNPWTGADDPDCGPPVVDAGTDGGADGGVDGGPAAPIAYPTKCWTQGTPSDAVQTATKYTLPAGRYLNTSDIKMEINDHQLAVAVSIPIYYQAWNYPHNLPTNWDDYFKGIVRYPNDADKVQSEADPDGHGILIVGWDDDLEFQQVDKDDKPAVDTDGKPLMVKGYYIFKNSWGTDNLGRTNTPQPGYGYISQQYISEYASAFVSDVPKL